jgi:Calcineurin-like phosphoesterase
MERWECVRESLRRCANSSSLIALAYSVIVTCATCCVAQALRGKDSADLPVGSWRFIVSGDSRNCGDVVMPAIAAHSARFNPSFYWHLGDLRAISKIDEDMRCSAQKAGQVLTFDNYQRRAWNDFVENQIAAFGDVTFYLGIGNHEVIPPKNGDAFKRQFFDWLDLPALHRQRQLDGEPALPEPYYHWIQGGVDFIYLDNSYDFFYDHQLTWLLRRLRSAKSNPEVKSVVVGMHEALPDSLANFHSLGDNTREPRARPSGEEVYKALLAFREDAHKPVYALASHSHFFMQNIFDTPKLKEIGAKPLAGWIVGTGGAVRYALPKDAPSTSKTNVYGYLVGTVASDGTIQFSFEEVHESDVPQGVQQRYPATFVPWCFTHNSQVKDDPKAPPDQPPPCTGP